MQFGIPRTRVSLLDHEGHPDTAGQVHANLVEVYISGLRRKLEAHGPRILHTVRGLGYVLRIRP